MPAPITNGEAGPSVRNKINESFTDIAGKAASVHGHNVSDVTGLQAAIDGKQATLVSGTNIKTVNGTSLLGSGDLTVSGGGISDGDKGDVTVSSSGATWTIDNNVVTNAKAADMATSTIKGRVTAGTGDPEDLTAAQVRTLLNVADGATANASDAALRDRSTHTGTQASSTISDFNSASRAQTEAALIAGANVTITPGGSGDTRTLTIAAAGSGGVADGDKGDITVSASGATWTIDNGVVTNAKRANMAQATISGRASGAGTGVPTDLTAAQVRTILNVADGATANAGTVTSVAATVPTGLTVSGSPITSSGTLAIGLDTGYVIPTQATIDGKLSSDLATEITATKATPIGADQIILLDSADSDTPKLATISSLPGSGTVTSVAMTVPTGLSVSGSPITSSGTLAVTLAGGYVIPTQATLDAKQGLASTVGTSLGTTGTVNLDLAALTGTIQTITLTGDPTFTTSNRAAGRKFELRLAAGGATRTVTWPAGWVAFGAALPTSIASGTVLRVAIECLGTADTNIDVTSVVSA